MSIVIVERKGMIRATPNGLIEETYFTVNCPREEQALSIRVVITAILESKGEYCVRYFERKHKTVKHDIIRVDCENIVK